CLSDRVIPKCPRGNRRLVVLLPERAVPGPRKAAANVEQRAVGPVVHEMCFSAGLAWSDAAPYLGPRTSVPQPCTGRRDEDQIASRFVVADDQRRCRRPGAATTDMWTTRRRLGDPVRACPRPDPTLSVDVIDLAGLAVVDQRPLPDLLRRRYRRRGRP